MRAGLRKLLLFGALAGTVGFLLLDPPAKAPEVVAAKGVGPAPQQASTGFLQLPDRGGLDRTRGELFRAPPPPPPQPAPRTVEAPAPVAPPVPYRFAGKVLKGSAEEVLISKGELVFPVKVGDTLDGMYRVESIGAERVELVYLPLGTRDRILVASTLETERDPAPVAAAPAQSKPAAVVEGSPAQLRWEGPERVQAGTTFSVALRVSTKEALRAAPMQLRFSPDVMEPVIVRPGKFFDEGSFTYRVNPAGSIFVGATSKPAAPGADAELLIVTFRPIKRGATAELSMTTLSLQGVAGRAIAHEQVSAFRATIH